MYYVYMCIYIYIYIEREREIELLKRPVAARPGHGRPALLSGR